MNIHELVIEDVPEKDKNRMYRIPKQKGFDKIVLDNLKLKFKEICEGQSELCRVLNYCKKYIHDTKPHTYKAGNTLLRIRGSKYHPYPNNHFWFGIEKDDVLKKIDDIRHNKGKYAGYETYVLILYCIDTDIFFTIPMNIIEKWLYGGKTITQGRVMFHIYPINGGRQFVLQETGEDVTEYLLKLDI